MPTTDFLYTLICDNDDALEVNIEFEYSPYIPAQTYGPAEHCYPAEGGFEGLINVTLEDGGELKGWNEEPLLSTLEEAARDYYAAGDWGEEPDYD